MLSRIMGLEGISISAVVTSLLALRFAPDILGARSGLSLVLRICWINYGVYSIYHLVIYPFFVSPLRHLGSPKVGTHALGSYH